MSLMFKIAEVLPAN